MKKTRRSIVLLGAAIAGLGLGSACDSAPRTDGAATSASAGSGAAPGTPDAVLDAALDEPDPYLRVQKLAEVLPTLGPEVIPHIERRLETSRAGMHGAEFEMLVRFWATQDPRAATFWTFGLLTTPYKIPAVHVAVETWARSDPKAALEAISSVKINPTVAQQTKLALVQGWFQKDRAGLESYIHGLGPTGERETALLLYALTLAQAQGSDAVIRWAEAIPGDDEAYKRSAYYQVTIALAGIDTAAAERWCDAQCDGAYGILGMRSVIAFARLRRGDPGEAVIEWLSNSPEAEGNGPALASAYGVWAYRERDAAVRWMQQKLAGEPQPWMPYLYGQYALQLAATSPPDAIVWAERIETPDERDDLLVRIARRWRRSDEAAAEAWLAQSALPEPARKSARNLEIPDNLPGSAPL